MFFFVTALLQTKHGYFTAIVIRVVYDPSLLKKCSHKDKPIVEMPICKKLYRKKRHKHSEK